MAGMTVGNNQHLIRSDVWSRQLKSLLMDDLQAIKFVRMLPDFTDGTVIHIPTLGEAATLDYAEGQAIKYESLATGDFEFTPDQYKYSAHSISEKFKRDSFYSEEVIAAFLPRQHRALMESIETRILSRGPSFQTASNTNTINNAAHRFVGSGTGESMALKDFALAHYALSKANVPMTNLVAIVDPSVAYTIQTQANITNLLTPTPMWSEVVKSGMVTGLKFRFNIYGFDVYVSNYLPNGLTDTIGGRTVTNGVANQFFSAASGDTNPFVGVWRQQPTVYSEFNKDLQQTEYLTIMEYGVAMFRPENMVVVITDLDVVA